MSLSKYKDLSQLSTFSEVQDEIFVVQKKIFDLKIKKGKKKNIQSHLFKHLKRRIAQLKYKQFCLNDSIQEVKTFDLKTD